MCASLCLAPYMYNLQILQQPNKKGTIATFMEEGKGLLEVYPAFGRAGIPIQVCLILPPMKNGYDEGRMDSSRIQ